jgi:ribbon-helix-helix CopG family protein
VVPPLSRMKVALVPQLCHSGTMDLTSYVGNLGREFATLAETGGEEGRALVERLTGSLESAIRMTLLEALSAAADEITQDLAPGSVELRLRGRDPNFVVTSPPGEPPPDAGESGRPAGENGPDGGPPIAEDGPTARINVRLPEQLKAAVEEAAAREERSVNAWLVRAASAALQRSERGPHPVPNTGGKRSQQHFTGWVR